jgi:hypothetical protein
MQKVVGSSPIIRFAKALEIGPFSWLADGFRAVLASDLASRRTRGGTRIHLRVPLAPAEAAS